MGWSRFQDGSGPDLYLGPAVATFEVNEIERQLHLNYNKWDTQVGDESVLSEQALIISKREWDWLCRSAEQLASESVALESAILEEQLLQVRCGVPKSIMRLLNNASLDTPKCRNMRFDFHPTRTGWCVSEINSDVPGGWGEAASLPLLYHPFYRDLEFPVSPLKAWGDSLEALPQQDHVAILSAPGFLEDQQVSLTFGLELQGRGISCSLIQSPGALEWSENGICKLRTNDRQITAIVRFYQIEWLCRLSNGTGWRELLQSSRVPVINPTISAVTESKRLPLVFREVPGYPTLTGLIPECRDVREVGETDWDSWVLKACYSNTGDRVYLCNKLPLQRRQSLVRQAQGEPLRWVAQRRFETCALDSVRGPLYPCVGMFVVNGRAAGCYARLSRSQITDGRALEAPVFIDRSKDRNDEG